MRTLIIFGWIVCSILCWWLYHKLFNIYYFNVGSALLSEFIGAGFCGALLMMVLISFWYITVPVMILLVLAAIGKHGNS